LLEASNLFTVSTTRACLPSISAKRSFRSSHTYRCLMPLQSLTTALNILQVIFTALLLVAWVSFKPVLFCVTHVIRSSE
jgi:hypothetical protein